MWLSSQSRFRRSFVIDAGNTPADVVDVETSIASTLLLTGGPLNLSDYTTPNHTPLCMSMSDDHCAVVTYIESWQLISRSVGGSGQAISWKCAASFWMHDGQLEISRHVVYRQILGSTVETEDGASSSSIPPAAFRTLHIPNSPFLFRAVDEVCLASNAS